jgi:hypothetical protein
VGGVAEGRVHNLRRYTAGGLLLRCECCSAAFCEDHMPLNCAMIGQCEHFKALGQNHPMQVGGGCAS